MTTTDVVSKTCHAARRLTSNCSGSVTDFFGRVIAAFNG